MNIYLHPPQPSLGLQRIADALRKYAPLGVEVVDDEQRADLVVLYAIGRCEQLTKQALAIRESGRKYAVVQCCLRSTQKPHTKDWLELWYGATAIWSYYHLNKAIADDYHAAEDFGIYELDNFYHAPLGADAGVFYPRDTFHDAFIIATSGLSRLSESVRECMLAARITQMRVLHVGPLQDWDQPHAFFSNGVSDESLAKLYSDCTFVSALRRKEGFELPGVEGLLCGARPICFDTPDYRQWYDGFADFIQETDRQGVIDQLVELFKRGARPVTEDERQRAVARFNWETIVRGFYERLG